MSADTFVLARSAISVPLIERMFGREGSRWEGDEYKTLSPLRADAHTGSFAIKRDGRWYDFATGEGGDFIDLVRRARSCTPLEAAQHIIRQAGCSQEPEAAQIQGDHQRVCAVLPVPVTAIERLEAACDNELTRRRYGILAGTWPYCQADGQLLFQICRYESLGSKKNVVPWYYGDDDAWRPRQPMPDSRPLLRLPELLRSHTPVLIVKGEKCATVAVPQVFPFFITAWSGGALAAAKTDWTPLFQREVTTWPDADEPGREAARRIGAELPQARILRIEDRPLGWDIADAVAESVDLERFIRNCPAEKSIQLEFGKGSPRLVTQRASDVVTRPVDWLWEGRIPLGEYSVLVGHPSSGKSTLAAALAAHVSAGIPFPDGTRPAVGDVLFLSAEESAAKALVPRLRVAGAALDRVSIVDIRLKCANHSELFSLAEGTDPIEAALQEMNNPRLVIIDSLTSCTAGIDTFRTDAFGPVLADLAQLSERRNVTTLCLAYFTKAVINGVTARSTSTGAPSFAS